MQILVFPMNSNKQYLSINKNALELNPKYDESVMEIIYLDIIKVGTNRKLIMYPNILVMRQCSFDSNSNTVHYSIRNR